MISVLSLSLHRLQCTNNKRQSMQAAVVPWRRCHKVKVGDVNKPSVEGIKWSSDYRGSLCFSLGKMFSLFSQLKGQIISAQTWKLRNILNIPDCPSNYNKPIWPCALQNICVCGQMFKVKMHTLPMCCIVAQDV